MRWDGTETLVDGGLVAQTRQALANGVAVVAEAGAGPGQLTRMTWLVAGLDGYRAARAEIGEVYRGLMG